MSVARSSSLTGVFIFLLSTPGQAVGSPLADAQNVTTDEDTATGITLAGNDPDGDPLIFVIVTQPANGTLTGTAPVLTYNAESRLLGRPPANKASTIRRFHAIEHVVVQVSVWWLWPQPAGGLC